MLPDHDTDGWSASNTEPTQGLLHVRAQGGWKGIWLPLEAQICAVDIGDLPCCGQCYLDNEYVLPMGAGFMLTDLSSMADLHVMYSECYEISVRPARPER